MVYTVIKKTRCSVCSGHQSTHVVAKDGKLVDCDGFIREEVPFAEALKYELDLQHLKETLIDK